MTGLRESFRIVVGVGFEGVAMLVTGVAVILLSLGLTASRQKRGSRRRARTLVSRGPRNRSWAASLAGSFETLRRQRRRPGLPASVLAALLDDMARRCSSGASLTTSFVAASASSGSGDRLRPALVALAGGATLDRALGCLTVTDVDTTLAVHVLRLCAVQGGNVSESLDRAAATLRERHAARAERVAQAAQAQLSAKVLTVVPVVFGAWTMLTTASVQRFITTPAGLISVTGGVALNAAGWTLMNRAIRGVR